jgi:hypothetical protein
MLRVLFVAFVVLFVHFLGYGMVNSSVLDYSKLGFISWIFTSIWYMFGLFIACRWYQEDDF